MNRDELLTKVAMEHSPEDWGEADTWTYDEHEYGWNEYQLRRTELINKPSWDDAPEWAEWLAQDESGEWFWFEAPVEMEEEEGEWFEKEGEDGRIDRASRGAIPAGHNWRDTLEPRPQAKSDTKTCKHCDVTFQRPRLDSVPDDRCMRCHDEITAIGWDEGEERIDRIAQSDASGDHYAQKSWWTHKPCTLCERQTTAKVSDDRPVCPECVVNGEEEFDASFRVFTEQAFPKQERYQDASGEDWIDEFARTATLEEFRGAMRFTIGKYNRRAGKKDSLISEITKMEDYCRRWREYELARAGQ